MKTKAPPAIHFTGNLDVIVPEQTGLSRAQRQMIQETFNNGRDLPAKTRFSCAIAEAVNNTVRPGLTIDSKRYTPNPKARAQFGKNCKGLPYLTVGVIDADSGTRYTLTWEGNHVPTEMAVTALKHDTGKPAKTVAIPLSLEAAKVHETGAKNGKRPVDQRRNHDTGKNGLPYPRAPRRSHNRLCDNDVDRLLHPRKYAKADADTQSDVMWALERARTKLAAAQGGNGSGS